MSSIEKLAKDSDSAQNTADMSTTGPEKTVDENMTEHSKSKLNHDTGEYRT